MKKYKYIVVDEYGKISKLKDVSKSIKEQFEAGKNTGITIEIIRLNDLKTYIGEENWKDLEEIGSEKILI